LKFLEGKIKQNEAVK